VFFFRTSRVFSSCCVAYSIQFIAKHIARADEDAQTWPMSLGTEGSNAGKEMW
jgi:hypothetical protein